MLRSWNDVAECVEGANELLNGATYRRSAQALAERYKDLSVEYTIAAVLKGIEQAIGDHSISGVNQ